MVKKMFLFTALLLLICIPARACPLEGHVYVYNNLYAFQDFECTDYYEWGCMGNCIFLQNSPPGVATFPAIFACGEEGTQYENELYTRIHWITEVHDYGWGEWVHGLIVDNGFYWNIDYPNPYFFEELW